MLVVTPCSPVGVGHGQLVHVRHQSLPVTEARERIRASAKRAMPRLPPCQSAYSSYMIPGGVHRYSVPGTAAVPRATLPLFVSQE